MKFAFAVAASATILFSTASPAAADWEDIALKRVAVGAESDAIQVESDKNYNRIRLCVTGGPILFKRVRVEFANGGHKDARKNLNGRECTFAEFEGGPRVIKTISLIYASTSAVNGPATVRIWAE